MAAKKKAKKKITKRRVGRPAKKASAGRVWSNAKRFCKPGVPAKIKSAGFVIAVSPLCVRGVSTP